MFPGSAASLASTGNGWKCWEGVYQVVVRPTIDVEPCIPRGPELLQMIAPLLLYIQGVPRDYLPDLVSDLHRGTSVFRHSNFSTYPCSGQG